MNLNQLHQMKTVIWLLLKLILVKKKFKIVNGPKISTETNLWTAEIKTNNPDFPYWGIIYDDNQWFMGDYIHWIHDNSNWKVNSVDF